jgi:hypothetical protein
MMSNAMTQHALCHVLWHNSIHCHSILFWNKIQYVAACYSSINSMSQRQALCHDMVCHINRYHIITQYATTISMSLQHELSHIKNNHKSLFKAEFVYLCFLIFWYRVCKLLNIYLGYLIRRLNIIMQLLYSPFFSFTYGGCQIDMT